jgi:hypothetical protein
LRYHNSETRGYLRQEPNENGGTFLHGAALGLSFLERRCALCGPLSAPLPSFGGAANPALDVAPGGVFFRPGSPGISMRTTLARSARLKSAFETE